jgi:serine/threonine protein kinase
MLLAEQLAAPQLDPVEIHVEECASCQERLERMVDRSPAFALTPEARHFLEPQPQADFLYQLKQLPRSFPQPTGDETKPKQDSASVAPTAAHLLDGLVQKRLGQYEIVELLGRGSMGVVYKAVHTELRKTVALKVLPASSTDEVAIARFKSEARAAGRLDHPNIVTAYDAGQADGVYFLVMSYVDGIDLARIVERRFQLSIPDACEAIRQAAAGLQHALERGLVHRDIKPSNLMLASNGVVKVLDLGIARSYDDAPVPERLTATGIMLGTADYLAPEQWENSHTVDTRADIYGLGCTLYHLLAGDPPFSGSDFGSILAKMRGHVQLPVPPIEKERPEVPAPLSRLLDRLLAKNPADRFATPGEVAEALLPFTSGANLLALLESCTAGVSSQRKSSSFALAWETDHPAHQSTDQGAAVLRPARPTSSLIWRYRAVLGLVSICLVLAIALVVGPWISQHGLNPTVIPVKIDTLRVSQYRGEKATPLGDVRMTTEPIFTNDALRISARLTAPGYCYLVAFNADGSEQLLYPEDPQESEVLYPRDRNARAMTMRPAKGSDVSYPKDAYFEPEHDGLQAIVLIASTQPLPPYAEWRPSLGTSPWKATANSEPSRWELEGQDYVELPRDRGKRVERGGAPSEFQQLCTFFRSCPCVEEIRALVFPVTKKK